MERSLRLVDTCTGHGFSREVCYGPSVRGNDLPDCRRDRLQLSFGHCGIQGQRHEPRVQLHRAWARIAGQLCNRLINRMQGYWDKVHTRANPSAAQLLDELSSIDFE